MNIIHILLMVGLWFFTVTKGKAYLSVRDEFVKSGKDEQPKELKDARWAFIISAITAVLYTIIKLAYDGYSNRCQRHYDRLCREWL